MFLSQETFFGGLLWLKILKTLSPPVQPLPEINLATNHWPACYSPLPTCPWSHVSLDFITGLPPSEGNTVILTAVNRFSKAAHFIPLAKLPSALEMAQLLVHQVFWVIPFDIVLDGGPQFASQVWQNFCNALGASVSRTPGYHPQSNGQTERYNQELEATLRCVVENNSTACSEHLVWVEFALNIHTISATGLPPFEASVGYSPHLYPSQETEIFVPSV